MIDIIGHEGYVRAARPVFWATPVLQINDVLLNPTTQQKTPASSLPELIDDKLITKLRSPIKVDERYAGKPLILIMISHADPLAKVALMDTGRIGGLVTHAKRGHQVYYILTGPNAFDQYSKQVIAKIVEILIEKGDRDQTQRSELIRLGFTLDSSNPFINALQVYFNGQSEHAKTLAMARLRGTNDIETFKVMLAACTAKQDAKYALRYEKGVAEGGGMDLGILSSILNNIMNLNKKLSPIISQLYPFMGSAVGEVTPRFHELVPGSAELKFTANLEQFSLKQKVARYLVLHHLEGLISGDSQLGLSQDSEVEKSLEIITSPSADTVLSHRRLGSSFLETIDWSSDNEQNYAVEDIHDLYGILGFQSGLIKDSSKIELKLFPSQSVLVSALDDGGGNAPAGIDLTARQLYKPAKYYLIRKTFKRRLHYYLKEVALLNPKEGLFISEIPSSVVRGAFQKNLKLRLHWDSAGVLFLEDTKIGAHKESNKAAAETWIQHLSAVYRNIELSKIDFEPKDWIRPQKLPRAYELERVLVSLHFLGGNAALPDLTEAINDRFVAYVRENNTMRAANKHPDLINVDKGKNIISLTPNGRAYVNIFIGLGGAVEYTSQYCGVVQSDS